MVEKKVKEVLVVQELPNQPLKEITGEDGKTYELITSMDAWTEMLIKIREIHKAVKS